jgi:hypothetical protein
LLLTFFLTFLKIILLQKVILDIYFTSVILEILLYDVGGFVFALALRILLVIIFKYFKKILIF